MIRKAVGTVGTLANGAVSTAVSVAKHPIGSAAMAAGLVKGATEAGIDLVRTTTLTGSSPTTAPMATRARSCARSGSQGRGDRRAGDAGGPTRQSRPGPGGVRAPSPDDLPEPIVIEAEPAAAEEAFHTEPKAASRDSDHGGLPGDREEIDGYVEEIPTDDVDIETLVGTTTPRSASTPTPRKPTCSSPTPRPCSTPGRCTRSRASPRSCGRRAEEQPE